MTQQRERLVLKKTKPSFTHEQKIGFGIVLGAGVFALFLGVFYLVRHIAEPFFLDYTGEYFYTQEQQDALLKLEQQGKDTDGDGLSDYDELYLYNTSPYLVDTDGDGYSDYTEVMNGTDPNCAPGANCAQTDDVGFIDLDFGVSDPVVVPNIESELSIEDAEVLLSQLSVEEIRELLLDSGADPETVQAIPDEDLYDLFMQILQEIRTDADLQNTQP